MVSRKFTVSLSIVSIALSIVLIFGIGRFREAARQSFFNTVSGADLLVGAKTGPVNLLLYSVFHIGDPTGNISYDAYEQIKKFPETEWTIPISLGESHQGYRVMGTDEGFFMHYLYSGDQSLTFASGGVFSNALEAVIGDEVARKLRYKIGDEISIMHGLSAHGIFSHDEKPFKITGILSPTGTNTDRLIILPLAGLEAIHEDWKDGIPPAPASDHINEENADAHRSADAGEGTAGDHYEAENYDVSSEQEHTPRALTAFLLGAKNKNSIFQLQQKINNFGEEPLLAVIPGLTLLQLWETVSIVERGFLILSVVVFIAGMLGMVNAIMISVSERRREIAILRALGADPIEVAGLILCETLFIALGALLTGLLMLTGVQILTNTFFKAHLGFTVPLQGITPTEWGYIAVIFLMAALSGIIPAIKAYLISLHTGVSSG